MILYTCGQKLTYPSLHPCGKAGRALRMPDTNSRSGRSAATG